MPSSLSCYECGRQYEVGERKRCACGEPLWYDLDTSEFQWPEGDERSMWRYASLLPVDEPIGVGGGAGGTPLICAERLDDLAGCRIHIKNEGANPTGSFKDRGSAVGAAATRNRDFEWVGALSHGNMAMSVAAHATSANLGCVVVVPTELSDDRFRAIGQFDPVFVTVDDFSAVNDRLAAIEGDLPIEFINADVPLRIEGQKTIAYEVCERFSPEVPDAIVVPVASGGNASAIWKGLRELSAAGMIESVPKLFLVQADASAPIATAYEEGDDRVSPGAAGETAAFSIVNKAPLSGNRALTAARETGGAVLSVSESELLEATARIADRAGLSVEPASAVTLAGARQLSADGAIGAQDDVVLIATGTGFKELAGVDPYVDIRSMTADTVETVLSKIAG